MCSENQDRLDGDARCRYAAWTAAVLLVLGYLHSVGGSALQAAGVPFGGTLFGWGVGFAIASVVSTFVALGNLRGGPFN